MCSQALRSRSGNASSSLTRLFLVLAQQRAGLEGASCVVRRCAVEAAALLAGDDEGDRCAAAR